MCVMGYTYVVHIIGTCSVCDGVYMCLSCTGFGQGVRKSMFSVAAIMGPLWAGGSVSISYYILLGVPLALLGIVMVSMYISSHGGKKNSVSDPVVATDHHNNIYIYIYITLNIEINKFNKQTEIMK